MSLRDRLQIMASGLAPGEFLVLYPLGQDDVTADGVRALATIIGAPARKFTYEPDERHPRPWVLESTEATFCEGRIEVRAMARARDATDEEVADMRRTGRRSTTMEAA